jgi:hypothetical protein
MAAFDYTDFYILDPSFNKFNDTELIEDDLIRLIIQKYQVLVYTNKGDVLGDVNIGTNLLELLYQTKLSSGPTQEKINQQIVSYIPEISQTPYELQVVFEQDPENFQEIMLISFKLDEFEIVNQIGTYL